MKSYSIFIALGLLQSSGVIDGCHGISNLLGDKVNLRLLEGEEEAIQAEEKPEATHTTIKSSTVS